MEINKETMRAKVGEGEYSILTDLTYVGSFSGQRPYLRRNTKVGIYKEIMKNYPDVYERLVKESWFNAYKKEVEDIPNIVIPKEVKNAMDGNQQLQLLQWKDLKMH